jgi:FixJ family two-component response regulator
LSIFSFSAASLTPLIFGLLNQQVASEHWTTEITSSLNAAEFMQKVHAEFLADLVRMADKLKLPT